MYTQSLLTTALLAATSVAADQIDQAVRSHEQCFQLKPNPQPVFQIRQRGRIPRAPKHRRRKRGL